MLMGIPQHTGVERPRDFLIFFLITHAHTRVEGRRVQDVNELQWLRGYYIDTQRAHVGPSENLRAYVAGYKFGIGGHVA